MVLHLGGKAGKGHVGRVGGKDRQFFKKAQAVGVSDKNGSMVTDGATGAEVVFFDKRPQAGILFRVLIGIRRGNPAIFRQRGNFPHIFLSNEVSACGFGFFKIGFQRRMMVLAPEGHHPVDLPVQSLPVFKGGRSQALQQNFRPERNEAHRHAGGVPVADAAFLLVVLLLP